METFRSDQTHTNPDSWIAARRCASEETDYFDVRARELDDTENWKLVAFTINDPENPKNWSKTYKWYCTMVVAFTCFVVAFASSVITADLTGPMKSFGVSREVSFLVIAAFVVGFGVGE
jgi:hypothetical protein